MILYTVICQKCHLATHIAESYLSCILLPLKFILISDIFSLFIFTIVTTLLLTVLVDLFVQGHLAVHDSSGTLGVLHSEVPGH